MAAARAPLIAALLKFAAGLRFKTLFFITGGLFILDLLLPDLIPFVDEIILGLLTLLFGSWKRSNRDRDETGTGTDGRTIEGEVVERLPPERKP